MTGKQRRQFEMLVRVRNFGNTNTALFAASPVAQQTFATIATTVDDLAVTSMKKMSASAAARSDAKALARRSLIELLQNASQLARNLRAAGQTIDGFVLPASRSDVTLLTAGRQFAADAARFEAEFSGHGMGSAHLAAATAAFESASNERGMSRSEFTAAKTRIQVLLTAALRDARRLDLIVSNDLDHDDVAQAQWWQLRRLEAPRGSRNAGKPESPDTATGQPPAARAVTAPVSEAA